MQEWWLHLQYNISTTDLKQGLRRNKNCQDYSLRTQMSWESGIIPVISNICNDIQFC
jgi:hypothetical protein